jgi:hypothetical protein
MIFSVPVGGPMDGYVDDLFRAAPSASGPTTAPTVNNLNANAVRGEMNRLFTRSLRKGSDFSPADQTYVAQVVAARTGLSQADAEKRVTEVTNQAKTATDAARKGAAKLSLWLAASMLAGAFGFHADQAPRQARKKPNDLAALMRQGGLARRSRSARFPTVWSRKVKMSWAASW